MQEKDDYLKEMDENVLKYEKKIQQLENEKRILEER